MGSIPFSGIAALANETGQIAAAPELGYERTMAAAQEREMRAQQIEAQRRQFADQDALTKAITQYDPTKNTLADIPRMVTQNGGSGAAALQAQQGLVTARANLLKMTDEQFEQQQKQNDLVQGVHDQVTNAPAEQKQQTYSQGLAQLKQAGIDISNEPEQYPGDQVFAQHLVPIRLHSALLADASKERDMQAKQAEAAANNAKAANENAQAGLNQIKLNLAKNSKPGDFDAQIDTIFPPNGPSMSAPNSMYKSLINGALSRGDLDSAKQYVDQAAQSQQAINKEIAISTNPQIRAGKAQTAAAEAAAEQPYKLQLANAEAKAKQLIEGTAQPVYAYDPKTNTTSLMSKTDALQAGMQAIRPVTETNVRDDTMLINRLSDVHQKISRYEQAMHNWSMGYNDRAAIQQLTQTDKFKMAAFGTEIPVDTINKLADEFHIKNLSSQARDAVVAYYNAREAMVGYNRVLSGSGRSSDKSLELQEQTLPDISIADHDMANRGFRDFKENLSIVGQGLPSIPGVKSPEQWERQVTGPQSGPQSANPRFSVPSVPSVTGYLSRLLGGR